MPTHQKNRYEKAQERKAETRFFKCFDFETNGRIVKRNKVRHVELNENMTIKIDNNQWTKPARMATTTTDNKVTRVKDKPQSTTKHQIYIETSRNCSRKSLTIHNTNLHQ